ncbi:phospholipase D-like domain-containing protein [Roseateles depolymerans]|uniref:phospholipase D n=1 Tax=Roseateles depolymerans TaxID=76731 RepID=A0A0U3LQW4_9BURK|nr:phospholipase D-like domain-containing protein [Roseateles depolymerans]ALV07383.1 phospholipase [Roseateles depolymerans]REG22404.1 phosphatidylserine/phosphatidylglycerophosphate/cardiolipin synthase-like enzyme [Roseateles depolymerans]
MATTDFKVSGSNNKAPFTLTLHRGEGMTLLAMNWRKGEPPADLVGFAIEYRVPGGDRFFPVKNRLAFRGVDGKLNPNALSTRLSPIQKFRWVHFPRDGGNTGTTLPFTYRVMPVFMDTGGSLSYGEVQEADIHLQRETVPGQLNVSFTRGFVSSQAFVDRYQKFGPVSEILPANAAEGLDFKPTHPKADEALSWMGFEARAAILDVLDQAIADPKAEVKVIAYDLNLPEVVGRLEKLGPRLQIIIDDSGDHGEDGSAENAAAARLAKTAGADHVQRQHVLNLQHNKMIVVAGKKAKLVSCGSTNFSWRGFYVQANNAVILKGDTPVKVFGDAFDQYWLQPANQFGQSASAANWTALALGDIKPQVTFSPHAKANARLQGIADDMATTQSSLLYSLAFLYQTSGPVRDAIKTLMAKDVFIYGMSDRKVGGLELDIPGGNRRPVFPDALGKDAPPPFSAEPTGGGGIRMHHKFVVIDFDKPTARVYLGSYNFSGPADLQNGENLLMIKDRRVATAYMVEALRLFDHYRFRIAQDDAATAQRELVLQTPPRTRHEKPWWFDDYHDPIKIKDRLLFA